MKERSVVAMAEEKKQEQAIVPPPQYNLDAKWDACLDLGVRRFAYFSLIGGFAGLLLFREFLFFFFHKLTIFDLPLYCFYVFLFFLVLFV